MTLLTIGQQAALEAGFPEPSTLIGNAEDTARRIRALADKEVRMLSRWRPWQALRKTRTFTTSADQAQYPLPADFRALFEQTAWDRTRAERLIGPAPPDDWQTLVSGPAAAVTTFWFRIRGDQFELYPTPSGEHQIAYDYLSDAPVDTDGDGVGDAASWQADSDTAVLDEAVIELGVLWRLLSAVGAPYQEQFNEYQRVLSRAYMRDGGAQRIRFGAADDGDGDPADIFDDALFSSNGQVLTVR